MPDEVKVQLPTGDPKCPMQELSLDGVLRGLIAHLIELKTDVEFLKQEVARLTVIEQARTSQLTTFKPN